jgi:hypothetical protein
MLTLHGGSTTHGIRWSKIASGALLSCLLVQAQASTPASPDELQRVKAYGDVSIAQDSVAHWGPWEEFAPPAAPPEAVGYPPLAAEDLYLPVPQLTPTEGLCTPGGICGFGAFTTLGSPDTHPYQLRASASGEPTGQDALPASIVVWGQTLSTGALLMPQSPALSLQGGTYASADQRYEAYVEGGHYYFDPAAVSAAWYQGSVSEANTDNPDSPAQRIWGMAGIVTPTADMLRLPLSTPQATYIGYDSDREGPYNGAPNVVLHVDFARQSLTGVINGGKDGGLGGSVQTSPGQSSNTLARGAVGFEFSGQIRGSNFTSTQVSAPDAQRISGSVVGAFFGAGATAVGGVTDIIKTTNNTAPASYQDARFVSPFVAVREDHLKITERQLD